MNKKRLTAIWITLVCLSIGLSGCALIGTAISAGAAYGIYTATHND
jgi:hypothetical protein